MTTCPHCARYIAERDEAIEALRQLREAMLDTDAIRGVIGQRFALPVMPAKILSILLKKEIVSREAFFQMFYADDPNGGPDPKTIDIHIVKVRKALREHGIELGQRWRMGWFLRPEDKARIIEMLTTAAR